MEDNMVLPARRSWPELSQRTRTLLIVCAAAEGCLKIAALVDLKTRPANQIRGTKPKWATAVILINSFGLAPLAYFRFGRRTD
jgi:hypothetical protein